MACAEATGKRSLVWHGPQTGAAQLRVTPNHTSEIVSMPPRGALRVSTDDWARSPHDTSGPAA
jgi:hypothetical protein